MGTFLRLIGFAVSLYATTGLAQDRVADDSGPLEKLRAEYDEAMAAWSAKYRGSRETPSPELIERYDKWPGWSILPRVVKLATADMDAPQNFEALKWVVVELSNAVGTYDREFFALDEQALAAARKHHLANPQVVDLFGNCARYPTPGREGLLRECLLKAAEREVRGLACYYLAECLRNKAQVAKLPVAEDFKRGDDITRHIRSRWSPEAIEFLRAVDADKSAAEAQEHCQRVLDEFDDIRSLHGYPFTIGKPTLGFLVRLERVQAHAPNLGQAAPSLAGTDLGGNPYNLIDHRGKVVVLHFWATWCPPCLETIAHLKKLREQHGKGRLGMAGLNYDQDRKVAAKFMAEQAIDWPSLWTPELGESVGLLSPGGRWPSVIVVDAKGILRFHDPAGEALARAVEELLREAGHDTPDRR
jgi:thiol-disulfide isomerase/thioredoxin